MTQSRVDPPLTDTKKGESWSSHGVLCGYDHCTEAAIGRLHPHPDGPTVRARCRKHLDPVYHEFRSSSRSVAACLICRLPAVTAGHQGFPGRVEETVDLSAVRQLVADSLLDAMTLGPATAESLLAAVANVLPGLSGQIQEALDYDRAMMSLRAVCPPHLVTWAGEEVERRRAAFMIGAKSPRPSHLSPRVAAALSVRDDISAARVS